MNSPAKMLILSDNKKLSENVEKAVRNLCSARKRVTGINGKRVFLTSEMIEELCQRADHAAHHAANGPLPNITTSPGAPPDNTRIILADDIMRICREIGISSGLRYSPPLSFVVELYSAICALIWPVSGSQREHPSAHRKTFARMKINNITRS